MAFRHLYFFFSFANRHFRIDCDFLFVRAVTIFDMVNCARISIRTCPSHLIVVAVAYKSNVRPIAAVT